MLSIDYIRLDEVEFMDGNAKKHDIGAIITSIKGHNFRVPMIVDRQVNPGHNTVLAGNGRLEALQWLYKERNKPDFELPKGIELADDGMFLVPCVVGIDSDSLEDAVAFLVDDNNLNIMGSEATALDMSKNWDMEGYLKLLEIAVKGDSLVSADSDDLALLHKLSRMDGNDNVERIPDKPKGGQPKLFVKFNSEVDKKEAMDLLKSIEEGTGDEWGDIVLESLRQFSY
jgi:hypothetical protein